MSKMGTLEDFWADEFKDADNCVEQIAVALEVYNEDKNLDEFIKLVDKVTSTYIKIKKEKENNNE